ncbi:Tad domain-containing protein [Qipengyuania gaetbuli]|uniref:TadE/TadG family type IV pilus assembly protein n=1 Tax=Qipengyuania gaetbuli TaxID=266952 RepID=UPI001C99056B|nr:Tad domain-containing protein [Qipengyuania gaetbuli]MBY6014722.1 Tad domain-containing protein [Qipengyuania gaetbuli]
MGRRIGTFLQRLKKDTTGNLLLMAGAGITALVGAAGISVDTVQWYLWKRQMQQAVDTGAVAGALAMSFGRDHNTAVTSEVGRTANTVHTIELVSTPPTSGAWTGDSGAIEVVATTSRALPFSSVFLSTPPTIRTRAVATAVAIGNPCVRALATDGTGIDVFGGAQVNLGCPVSSNSPGGVSVDLGGSSFLNTDLVMSVGGIDYGSGNLPSNASLVSYGLPVEDPLASRNLTWSPTCNLNNVNVTPSQTRTLDPCRYNNGLRIQGTVYLRPGVYVIDGGSLTINSGAEVFMAPGTTGGVTFILTGNNPTQVATLSVNGSAEIDIRAPTMAEDPLWGGILFYQDRIASDLSNTINGGSDINLHGAIYFPTNDLIYNGDSSQTAQCLLIVTQRVRFGGTNNIDNNCDPDLTTINSSAFTIRVVE